MPTINVYTGNGSIKVVPDPINVNIYSQAGPQGPPGPPGNGIVVKGSVPNEADLPPIGNAYGDVWITENDSHGWVWNRPGSWADLGVFAGPPGPPGPQGIQGAQGNQGAPGATGPQGPTGATGPPGPQGPNGTTGATGPAGATGAQGPQGPPGSIGNQGPIGQTGPTGATGPAGATGPQGPAGPQGTGITIKGTVPTSANLPTTGNTVGDVWIAANTGHGWSWQSNLTWVDIGPIQGPPGATGPAGPTGPTGPTGLTGGSGPAGSPGTTGATGAQGPQGNPGVTGATGPAGQGFHWRGAWASATAYILDDTVSRNGSSYIAQQPNQGIDPATDSGTNWQPVALAGAPGATGAQGPTGTTGPPGSQGPTGNQGPTGATGAQGPQGPQGPPGSGGGISANANNKATLGTDSLILVQGTAAGIAATTHAQTVSGDDPQLINARTPIAHGATHAGNGTDPVPIATPTVAGLVPAKPNAGANATTTQVVMGDDTRLTNSRVPTAHASTHNLGGSDAIAPDWTQIANKPAGSSGGVSANANNKATLGSDSLILVQGTAAGVAATTHSQTVSGDDPQLTNPRTPTAHGATHVAGDLIPVASGTAPGLVPTRSGAAGTYLDVTGAWSVPPGTGAARPVILGETAADPVFTSGIVVPRYANHPDQIWTYGAFDDHFDAGSINAKWVQTLTAGTVNPVTAQAGSKLCLGGQSPAATATVYENSVAQTLPAQATHQITVKALYSGFPSAPTASLAPLANLILNLEYGAAAGGIKFVYASNPTLTSGNAYNSNTVLVYTGAGLSTILKYWMPTGIPPYFQFIYDSSKNTTINFSNDGITWMTLIVVTAAQSGFTSNNPTQFRIGMQSTAQSPVLTQFDWIKHV
jgi:hypothetical protein